MSTSAIITAAQLAERWSCSIDVVYDRVRTKGVPFVWLGRGEPKLSQAGRKHMVFRFADIEDWEASQVHVWPSPDAIEPAPRPSTAGKGRGSRALAEIGRMGLD
jgi:hypothetical protein